MDKLRALVIDDDKYLGEAFVIALRHYGFIAEHIIDSTQALSAIETRRPDVIMLDINMPRVSGVDILRAVRANPALADMKIIVVTAGGLVTQNETVNQLADLVLLKPVSMTQITSFAERFAKKSPDQQP